MNFPFQRKFVSTLLERFSGSPESIQILIGPRQVGKSVGAWQIREAFGNRAVMESADAVIPPDGTWIENCWNRAHQSNARLLIIDEVQKVHRWSEIVKKLWDADKMSGRAFHVLLLGSSSLLVQRGLSESLAGRFELIRCSHWSFAECQEALGWSLETWLFFGGYPGSRQHISEENCDEKRWRQYILDSMVETVLARDMLQMQIVTKPALLRQLFRIVCQAPAQIVAFDKMLGQLTSAGNVTTLAHYLQLFDQAFLCCGLQKYSKGTLRSRGSSPKLIVHNNALVTALNPYPFRDPPDLPENLRAERQATRSAWRGRLIENAVGARLAEHARSDGWELRYWRERTDEVDYVLEAGQALFGIEIKSGRVRTPAGLHRFVQRYPKALPVVISAQVSPDGFEVPLEGFFNLPPDDLIPVLIRAGLQNVLQAPVELLQDYGWIGFRNMQNGKSASFPPGQVDPDAILAKLR